MADRSNGIRVTWERSGGGNAKIWRITVSGSSMKLENLLLGDKPVGEIILTIAGIETEGQANQSVAALTKRVELLKRLLAADSVANQAITDTATQDAVATETPAAEATTEIPQ